MFIDNFHIIKISILPRSISPFHVVPVRKLKVVSNLGSKKKA